MFFVTIFVKQRHVHATVPGPVFYWLFIILKHPLSTLIINLKIKKKTWLKKLLGTRSGQFEKKKEKKKTYCHTTFDWPVRFITF